ncbi:MAG TPA: adenylate/guanylate cyclase domain-containing protein [Gaiellaceae bacterium]|nr:adenylate/guanylate cyclase domain-containing protein [Gaiellaceae bacterium]
MGTRALPSGTVTFLFTDVEGSTRLLQEHGSAYADLLEDHRRVIREAFERHDGVEVDTQGDAFFVAFSRATDAVAAAVEAQGALRTGPILVRMGIHTGEPLVTQEGYVGMDVHRAARIAASAHGGQIVVSETTRRLLQADALTRDLGEHRLKDLIGAERLFQLGEGDFPALRTLDATNLPVVSMPLIGRERELEELVELLSNGRRLITLTGPGGTGKTRLALQVAAELVGKLHDGVFWVSLAGLTDPELFPSEVAQTIGARDDLTGFLRGRQVLFLLDNFEHLLAAAPLVSAVLGASAQVRVLVTSRAPLRVAGEQEYRLEPLPQRQAAALFCERARAVGREIAPDATVEEICRRLDGLPLAVELAAARTRLLAPERLLERLDSALAVLTSGARDAPERQRTLRATLEWSYDLLDPRARELFARLSVFSGAFPLEAAEEVCGAELDDLGALVDYSLVKPIGDDRFLMLETIGEYALERLREGNEEEELRRRHAGFFSALAEQAYAHRFDGEAEWSARLERDHDDLRAAFDWLSESDPDRALELAGALGWFWLSRGLLREGSARLAGALDASLQTGHLRARALASSGALVARHGDVAAGIAELEAAVAMWRDLGDLDELASALDSLGWPLVYDANDNPRALEAFEQSLELRRELGDAAGATRALVGIAQVLVAMGETERAEAISLDLLDSAAGDARTEHFAYHFLADCALIRGEPQEAGTRYRQSLRVALPLGDVVETSFEVQGVAMSEAGAGNPRRALVLAASVEALWESLGLSLSVAFWDALLERYLGPARAALGDDYDAVRAEGRALAFDDAVELALRDDAEAAKSVEVPR